MKGLSEMNLAEGAIGIIVLILIVSLGATVLQTTANNVQLVRATDGNVTDASNPYTVNTTVGQVSLATLSTKYNGLSPTVSDLTAFNATSGAQLPSNRYVSVLSTNPPTFNWTSALSNMTNVNFSYTVTYNSRNYDYNVSVAGLTSLITYSNFFSVIVVVAVFAVIIGLFTLFSMRSKGAV